MIFSFSIADEKKKPDANKTIDKKVVIKNIKLKSLISHALKNHPIIKIQGLLVRIDKGSLLASQATFDYEFVSSVTDSRDKTPAAIGVNDDGSFIYGSSQTDAFIYSNSINKLFRFGGYANLSMTMQMGDIKGDGVLPEDTASVVFTFSQPLLKGFGESVNTAQERSANTKISATRYAQEFVISQLMLQLIGNYWGYQASLESLTILKASESRTQTLMQETKRLIEKGMRPAAELNQIKATLANKVKSRINAEKNLFNAKIQLALASGLEIENINDISFAPMGLPKVMAVEKDLLIHLEKLSTYALAHRKDYLSQQMTGVSAKIIRDASLNQLKPSLNFNATIGYKGLDFGAQGKNYFTPFTENTEGVNFAVNLEFKFPFKNRAARGSLLSADSALQIQKLTLRDLKRTIISELATSLNEISSLQKENLKLKEAVGLFEMAIKNEKKKLKMGLSTFLDLLNFEDQLTSTQGGQLQNKTSLIIAVAKLNHVLGLLVQPSANQKLSVSVEAIKKIPLVGIK